MVLHKPIATICLVLGILLGTRGTAWCQAAGQPSPDFYKNKQIRLIIGYPVGNDYDLAGRFLARYLAKHIPGEPTIIVQNMPSAASIAAANFLYAQAPRDGTAFGSFSRNMPSQALMGQANVEVDPRRFSWLGATSLPARVCVRWVTAPIRTPADLFTQEFIVGGAGAGSSLNILPTVFNHVLGTKFRIVEDYRSTQEVIGHKHSAVRTDWPRRQTHDRGDRVRGQDHPPAAGGRSQGRRLQARRRQPARL